MNEDDEPEDTTGNSEAMQDLAAALTRYINHMNKVDTYVPNWIIIAERLTTETLNENSTGMTIITPPDQTAVTDAGLLALAQLGMANGWGE